MTTHYFEKIKKRIARLEWLVERESIDTEYDEDADIGNIGGNIVFKDGSVIHFKEIFIGEKTQYRFHYMDERNNLIFRWDNAPHHKELKTFPHHVHLPDGVKENKPVKLVDVLDKIEDIVIERLG
ncbi:MAG: hypothetical protein SCABRO_03378 [Candidatus Scalindua brodae]|uniref:Uncharacterized protein n=1 Tax=Candidatus Scalindua brodae TaxID=237368 RepID=A0A0B0EFN7_9BACT|nr:MAG: hypothetical protein SCABRO_03378 [Candidatus Scalindua brodae]